jgi:hypothetical protein
MVEIVGLDGGNSLGSLFSLFFSLNPLFDSWMELNEGVGEGIHTLCLVRGF